MPRNINRRVEVLFPVQDMPLIRYLRDEVLQTALNDNVKARVMQQDGSYIHLHPKEGETSLSLQTWLLNRHQRMQKE